MPQIAHLFCHFPRVDFLSRNPSILDSGKMSGPSLSVLPVSPMFTDPRLFVGERNLRRISGTFTSRQTWSSATTTAFYLKDQMNTPPPFESMTESLRYLHQLVHPSHAEDVEHMQSPEDDWPSKRHECIRTPSPGQQQQANASPSAGQRTHEEWMVLGKDALKAEMYAEMERDEADDSDKRQIRVERAFVVRSQRIRESQRLKTEKLIEEHDKTCFPPTPEDSTTRQVRPLILMLTKVYCCICHTNR